MAIRYGKYSSRKFWFSVGTSVLIFLCGLVAAYIAGFRSALEVVVGGLLGALGIYTGSSVGAKYVAGKTGQIPDDEGPMPEKKDPPKDPPKKLKD